VPFSSSYSCPRSLPPAWKYSSRTSTFCLCCSILAALRPAGPAPMIIVSNMRLIPFHQMGEFLLLFDIHVFFNRCEARPLILFSIYSDAALRTVADVAVYASWFPILLMFSECPYAIGEQRSCETLSFCAVDSPSLPLEGDKVVLDGAEYLMMHNPFGHESSTPESSFIDMVRIGGCDFKGTYDGEVTFWSPVRFSRNRPHVREPQNPMPARDFNLSSLELFAPFSIISKSSE